LSLRKLSEMAGVSNPYLSQIERGMRKPSAEILRQIARALELPEIELAELWNRLPLDDHQLAERLGCSRQQVINLRSAARKRLTRRLEAPRDGGPRLRVAGNTGSVPTSLGDES
ncbi:MAG TPA: helix-turn-helix domain-containing protein, partial [Vicinamibacteria bacterium]